MTLCWALNTKCSCMLINSWHKYQIFSEIKAVNLPPKNKIFSEFFSLQVHDFIVTKFFLHKFTTLIPEINEKQNLSPPYLFIFYPQRPQYVVVLKPLKSWKVLFFYHVSKHTMGTLYISLLAANNKTKLHYNTPLLKKTPRLVFDELSSHIYLPLLKYPSGNPTLHYNTFNKPVKLYQDVIFTAIKRSSSRGRAVWWLFIDASAPLLWSSTMLKYLICFTSCVQTNLLSTLTLNQAFIQIEFVFWVLKNTPEPEELDL